MAYTKTVWVNGTAPAINDTNLNKIEQGIADALPIDGTGAMTGKLVTIGGTTANPAIISSLDADTGILFPSAGRMSFTSNGTEIIYLHSNTNVAIGHNAPTAKLDVAGDIQIRGAAAAGSVFTITPDATSGTNGTTIANSFASGGYGPIYIQNGGSTRMTIGVGGNVGIGVTPTVRLHVQSTGELFRLETTTARGSGNNFLQFNDPTGQKAYFGFSSGANDNFYMVNALNSAMFFGNNGGENMRIASDGKVGIGGIAPSELLEVSGSSTGTIYAKVVNTEAAGAGAAGISLANTGTGSRGFQIYVPGNTATNYKNSLVFNDTGVSIPRMVLNASGYLLITASTNPFTSQGAYHLQVNGQIWATSATIATSDSRFKENVSPLEGALDIVKSLNPVQFNWKHHDRLNFNTDHPTIGFIAQEVKEVLENKPYLNSVIKQNSMEYEEEGETKTEEYLGIAEGNLIAILTKAVKELAAEVEALKNK